MRSISTGLTRSTQLPEPTGPTDGSLQPFVLRNETEDRPIWWVHTDFLVQPEKDDGVPGLIKLFGIESPSLTACLVSPG